MGFRFQRRIKLLPGITMNVGKNGSSLSFGPRGAKITVGQNGIRKTVGIPGTGLSYSSYSKFGSASNSSARTLSSNTNKVNLGFFTRLIIPKEEKNFIDGVKAFLAGDLQTALTLFQLNSNAPDSAFIAGIMLLNANDYVSAQRNFSFAEQNASQLGVLFSKYNIDINISFPITDILTVNLVPSVLAVKLAKVEILQHQRDFNAACNILLELFQIAPDNLLVQISLAELVLESAPHNAEWLNYLASALTNVENDTPIHTVLLYYKSVVLKNLGLYDAALDVLSKASRKKSGRSVELLQALCHEKALIYEAQGNERKARSCWEKIYAEDPTDRVAAKKLNLI